MNRTVKILLKISYMLGKIPSMGYAVGYLICIPVFALFYLMMPQPSFYHGTIQHELSLKVDAQKIEKKLLKEIVLEFKDYHGSLVADDGKWSVNIPSIRVSSFSPGLEKAEFKIRLELIGINENKGIQSVIPLNVSFEYPQTYATLSPKEQKWTVYKKLNIQNRHLLAINPLVIFPSRVGTEKDIDKLKNIPIFIPISSELQDEVFAIGMSAKGVPSSASFARMFYFSAVTLTTLGYGDIVPITNIARIATAIESILGIILIGLFLNSLAKGN